MINIKKLTKRAIALLAIIIVSCSCDLFRFGINNNNEIKEIDVTIAYKTPIYADTNDRLEIEGNIVYTTELWADTVCAINMDTGDIKWRKGDFHFTEVAFNNTNPVVIGDYIYIVKSVYRPDPLTGKYEKVEAIKLDKKNGNIIERVSIGEESNKLTPRMFSIDGYKGKLYWGNWGGRNLEDMRGLIYFDTVTKEYGFCYRTERLEITENIVVDEETDTLYLIKGYNCDDYPEYDPNKPEYYPSLVALDINQTDDKGEYKVKWELKDIGVYRLSSYKDSIVGDRLYVSGYGVTCINKHTGKKIWANYDLGEGSPLDGITIENGRIYIKLYTYTNEEDDLFCIDANTGKTIWRNRYSEGGSISIPPQVYKGYVYCVTQGEMIVLEEKTGRIIGRDPKVRAGALATGRSVRYKDLMIFKSLEGYVYAIKMDMHRRL